MNNEEKILTIINEDGKEINATILFTHHSEETGKDYVVFKPEDDEVVTAACYKPDGENGELEEIETEEEWEMLDELLENYLNDEEDQEEEEIEK